MLDPSWSEQSLLQSLSHVFSVYGFTWFLISHGRGHWAVARESENGRRVVRGLALAVCVDHYLGQRGVSFCLSRGDMADGDDAARCRDSAHLNLRKMAQGRALPMGFLPMLREMCAGFGPHAKSLSWLKTFLSTA